MLIRNSDFNADVKENSDGKKCLFAFNIKRTDDTGCFDFNQFEDLRDIEVIGKRSFRGILGVDKLILPQDLETVEEYAFAHSDIHNIVWPASCLEIPDFAFAYSTLENIYNIDNVRLIGEGAFSGCRFRDLYIPDGIEVIPHQCFRESKISSISGCRNVRMIDTHAFFGCNNLEKFCIPEHVTEIPSGCFSKCEYLRELTGMEHIRTIGTRAFSFCKSLTHIQTFDSVFSIGEFSFYASGIEDVSLENSVCSAIAEFAFSDSKLKSFKAGYFMQEVNASAFANTPFGREVKY